MEEQIQPQQPTTPEPEFQPSPPQGETLRSQPDKKLSIYVLVGLIVAGVAFEFYIWEKEDYFLLCHRRQLAQRLPQLLIQPLTGKHIPILSMGLSLSIL